MSKNLIARSIQGCYLRQRMPTILDIFLLMLIRDGVSIPYDWQTRARISTGASLPAIRRLLLRGFVEEAEKSPRRRREFTITAAGRRELQGVDRYLEIGLDETIGDLESVLRLVCMAIVQGKREIARKLLVQAAEEHSKRSRRAKRSALVTSKDPSLADLYASALAHCEGNRQEATAKSIESLVSLLGLGPDPTSPSRRRSKRSR